MRPIAHQKINGWWIWVPLSSLLKNNNALILHYNFHNSVLLLEKRILNYESGTHNFVYNIEILVIEISNYNIHFIFPLIDLSPKEFNYFSFDIFVFIVIFIVYTLSFLGTTFLKLKEGF